MRDTIRLTVAQALVKFLSAQYSESDGEEQKLFAGCFGIFGHGNVAGIGQALLQAELEEPERPAVHPGSQRAGHGAHRGRVRPDEEPACRPTQSRPASDLAPPTW